MGFGHIYADAEQGAVLDALSRHLHGLGFEPIEMTAERHPSRMKEIDENRLRLYWIAPRLGRWTGIFEHRYYDNAARRRWGYTDEELAPALSRILDAEAYRIEVVDQAGLWIYARYTGGTERDWKVYQDTPAERSLDPDHARYELNRIIEREGFKNVGLGYENIPGPMVRPIERIPQSAEGVEGLEGFVHRAYQKARSG
ncbi:MAG: hypothetical protein HY716_13175 [Planctomycetes bacterium]|nr:hypothetical protein [Planctomycetota bacterium]